MKKNVRRIVHSSKKERKVKRKIRKRKGASEEVKRGKLKYSHSTS